MDQSYNKKLIESERKYRLLAENSIDCIWTMDLDLKFTYLSPSIEQIVGAKPEEWIGTKLKDHFPKKEFLKAAGYAMKAIRYYKTFNKVTFETKVLDINRREVDVEITSRIAKDEDGKLIGLQGTTRDISDRKKTEQELIRSLRERNILLSEVHHRVKNNMQLIMSLLEIQKSYISPNSLQTLKEIADRIRILADIHQDFYYSGQIYEIDIADQIHSILHNLATEYSFEIEKINIDLDIPKPLVNLDIAIPLGLIVNELLTVSFKLFSDAGNPSISLSILHDTDSTIEKIIFGCDGVKIEMENCIGWMEFSSIILKALAAQLNLSIRQEPSEPDKIHFLKH